MKRDDFSEALHISHQLGEHNVAQFNWKSLKNDREQFVYQTYK